MNANEALAASVVEHLCDAGLLSANDEAAVAQALATGRVTPDGWVHWIENGLSAKERPVA